MNIYAVTQLQYKWSEQDKFSYFAMSNNGDIEFCNVLPYGTNFKKFEVTTYYDSENKETLSVEPLNTSTLSHATQNGIFHSDGYSEAQYLFMELNFELGGGTIRLDPNKMKVLVNIETPIIWIIPYSTTMQYSGFDFNKIMKGERFEC